MNKIKSWAGKQERHNDTAGNQTACCLLSWVPIWNRELQDTSQLI